MMTNENTTARQAGLTDEQIADAIPLTAMIVYGAVSGDPKTVRMNLGELREFAANILAAHSADARNGEGVYELLRKFLDFADAEYVPNYLFEQARALLAAPAAGTGQEPGCGDGEDCDACLSEAATGAQGLTQEGRNG